MDRPRRKLSARSLSLRLARSPIGPLMLCAFAAGCSLVNRTGVDSRAMVASRSLSQRGASAIEQRDWAVAETVLAEAVEVCSACPEARRYYAETLWHKGDAAGAVEQLESAVELAPQDATLHVRLAEMKLALGRPAEARDDADLAIDLDPQLAAAWIVRSKIQQQGGEPRLALADLHRALACEAPRGEVLVEVAELYRQLGEPQRALMSLQSVAETYPPGSEPPQVLYLSGLAYSALGRHDDALLAYRGASQRGGADAELSYRIAETYWLSQQPDGARQAVAEALRLNPQHVPSQQLLERIELANRPAGVSR